MKSYFFSEITLMKFKAYKKLAPKRLNSAPLVKTQVFQKLKTAKRQLVRHFERYERTTYLNNLPDSSYLVRTNSEVYFQAILE